MKANHSTTKEINEPIEKHMSCAGIRSFMNSSKVKGLSSQLLLWKFQYKAELSCDWLTARQWWHTWIPVQLVRQLTPWKWFSSKPCKVVRKWLIILVEMWVQPIMQRVQAPCNTTKNSIYCFVIPELVLRYAEKQEATHPHWLRFP